MKLYIDGTQADVSAGVVQISIPSPLVARPATASGGGGVKLQLPMTARNMALVGDTEQVNAAALFNSVRHQARIEQDGCTVLEGTIKLIEAVREGGASWSGAESAGAGRNGACTESAGRGYYRMQVDGHNAPWIRSLAGRSLAQATSVSAGFVLTGDAVRAGWSSAEAIKFFPVQRGSFRTDSIYLSAVGNFTVLSLDTFQPFVSVKALVEAIFRGAGYTIKSDFFASALFSSLYVSGNCVQDPLWSANKRKMDFCAGSFSDKTATADSSGTVFTNAGANSTGKIVDTADQYAVDAQGNRIPGVFDNGGCVGINSDRIWFTPTGVIKMGFEYKLCYRSDYYLESRDRLKCFNRIELGDGVVHTFEARNTFSDLRTQGNLQAGYSYLLVIFDYTPGMYYELEMTTAGAPVFYRQQSRTGQLNIPASVGNVGSPTLRVSSASLGPFVPFTGDWAIYEGWVAERGSLRVAAVLRDRPATYTPLSPKYFDTVRFSGAEAGATMTIERNATIRPVFGAYLAEGDTVRLGDIMEQSVDQLGMVDSLGQMFNLVFHTDETSHTVCIEPLETLLDPARAADWSRAVDRGQNVTVEENIAGLAGSLATRYAAGDAAVDEWNAASGTTLGSWRMSTGNPYASGSEDVVAQPLFAPSITALTDLASALDLWLLEVRGGADDDRNDRSFPMKIVSFCGMAALPEGQYLYWDGAQTTSPLVAFHPPLPAVAQLVAGSVSDTGSGTGATGLSTLCFEDRDGMAGLHRFYDRQLERTVGGRRIVVSVFIPPQAIERMKYVTGGDGDAGLFELGVDDKPSLFILETVAAYDPGAGGMAKCTFLKY